MNEHIPEDKHSYQFIGRVGSFCPIKPEAGGGILYRMNDDKYYAATGTKGYRFLESQTVKDLHKEDDIDMTYFDHLSNKSVKHISEFGDFDYFASDAKEPPYDYVLNLGGVSDQVEEIPFE